MKNTGMVRPLDELGRIVIPKEIRQTLGIDEGDPLEFFEDLDGKQMMIRKLKSGCLFCKTIDTISDYKGQLICEACVRELKGPNLEEAKPEIAAALEVDMDTREKKRTRRKVEETLQRLTEVIQKHPNASQGELAKILGISQPYISQLIRKMDKK
ncbi:AbrB/MazE/SpoVT family DNA-binding domain-containing protein [Paenibacillus sp. Y412MC10]|uniref:AbrB/MazE/SpoVT family DNA-binding domain-containing protein n=1 Tax=Geobacillus sp. (strain Y412MC10) TaxID=481743 RepID=UPI0011A82F61|nr:AbrB/MazE/SpoVT family DNA-binding domain-containing protein [Paenibacillus sp. Y412MC10]